MTVCLTCGIKDPAPDRKCKSVCFIEGRAESYHEQRAWTAVSILRDFDMIEEANELAKRAGIGSGEDTKR